MFDEAYASGTAERLAEGAMPQGVLAAVLFVLFVLGLGLAVSRSSNRWGPLVGLGAVLAAGLGGLFWMGLNRPSSVRIDDIDAITIHVRAYRWRWEFEQPNGMVSGELNVPVRQVVRLRISSEPSGPRSPAVIHQLSIPALGVRTLVIPGQTTEVTFRAERLGRYAILCTELCGAGHSRMRSAVQVMSLEEYEFPAFCTIGQPPEFSSEAEWGERLFSSNGCVACHTVDGTEGGVGPDLLNIAGRYRRLESGEFVLADDAYLVRAIVEPEAERSAGYAHAAMPAFSLPQSQLDAIVAYMRGWSVGPGGQRLLDVSPRESPRD